MAEAASTYLFRRWHRIPLYLRIIGGLVLGVVAGLVLKEKAHRLELPAMLVLRILGALAPPLILIAVLQALIKTHLRGAVAVRLIFLLLLNTTVAILIGLLVANVIKPGKHANLKIETPRPFWESISDPREQEIVRTLEKYHYQRAPELKKQPLDQFLENVPGSLLRPLVDNNVIGVIFVAVAFGLALRRRHEKRIDTAADLVDVAFECIATVLQWVIDLVPLAVFGIVASILGTRGFAPFKSLGWFVAAVLIALVLQAGYYLARVRMGSWVRPGHLLRGCRDAMVMAFSTDFSTATMPVTFACLRDRVGLREESASMGALVGANFNNDGTALYEAMSALFIAQLIGRDLSLGHQLTVVLTSIIASVGAAGIPEAGLVTMTLVFGAVGLPTEYIALLLTVDWFLDRSRTVINVMGDMNVSCLLDGKTRDAAREIVPAVVVRPGNS